MCTVCDACVCAVCAVCGADFAMAYYKQNKVEAERLFKNAEGPYIAAYSILMLNTGTRPPSSSPCNTVVSSWLTTLSLSLSRVCVCACVRVCVCVCVCGRLCV